MLKIDTNLLQELGLGALPDGEKNSLLKHIYETLEMRVGMRLADQMTNQQLDEFEQYFEAKDDAGAFKWLEANFPNYKDIVQEEFDKLKGEIRESAPHIVAASQAAMATGPAPQPAQQSALIPEQHAGDPNTGYQPAQPPAPAQPYVAPPQPAQYQPPAPAADPYQQPQPPAGPAPF